MTQNFWSDLLVAGYHLVVELRTMILLKIPLIVSIDFETTVVSMFRFHFHFHFHFKIIYPGYNSVYILFYNWPCKNYLQNKELYNTKFTIKIKR